MTSGAEQVAVASKSNCSGKKQPPSSGTGTGDRDGFIDCGLEESFAEESVAEKPSMEGSNPEASSEFNKSGWRER